jgi:hypothetical protein
MDSMILDGTIRKVNFQLAADNSITTIIPHFWINAGKKKRLQQIIYKLRKRDYFLGSSPFSILV